MGFIFVEIIVVVAILAILSNMSYLGLNGIREGALVQTVTTVLMIGKTSLRRSGWDHISTCGHSRLLGVEGMTIVTTIRFLILQSRK